MTVTLPLRLISEANQRGSWHAGAKRAKGQRSVVSLAVNHWRHGGRHHDALILSGGLAVTLTRIGPKKLDTDNLARACKAVRDGVADALGVDDGDERIEWRYKQRRAQMVDRWSSPRGPEQRVEEGVSLGYGVEIRIEAAEPETRAHASLTATPAKLGVSCDDALPESLTKPLKKRSKVR